MTPLLRMDRMPHIWCSTCGIGTAVSCFAAALEKAKKDTNLVSIVSGIGCTGRVAGYLKLDSFHTTHGRAIPFATGLKLARPDIDVVVFSGDGDLISIGGNHFIHAARRNMDLLIICVNNFIYAMTGGQVAPTTPCPANASTMPHGNYEHPFNLPYLAASSGASYVSRWTALHVRRLTESIATAMNRKGFRFIEIICPCPTLYARRNKLGDGLTELKYYWEHSTIDHDANLEDIDIDFKGHIVVGNFRDRRKPTFVEQMNERFRCVFGDKYKDWGGSDEQD